MQNVNDREAIKKIDPRDTYGSTDMLVQQCKTAWFEVNALPIDFKAGNIKNIVFCGMGASIYGALVTKALLGASMPFPTEVISDYHLPAYVDQHTLVVLTSYSGTTEEVLSCADEAKAKNAKMLILTRGGPLAEFAKINSIPAYIFDGKLNPSSVPRLGNGYSILGLIGLLNKARIIDIEDKQIEEAITRLEEKLPEIKGQALKEFETFENKIPVIITGEHLAGNGQIIRNQFNETSKTFSCLYLVPDLNHHLMEGLQFPTEHNLHFLILNSPNFTPKIKQRMQLTMDVIKQNNHAVHEFMTSGQTIYDDFLEALAYGSYMTLFLAIRYDQDPAVNPWVDWFKNELKK
ncbi:bifunctional phosphoglucose/phosphomannose isomerase [soil metagenome]